MDCLPVGWAEVGTEGQSYLEVENVVQNIGEGAHHIRVMLELAETALDVICMDNYIKVRVCDAEVVYVAVEPLLGVAKGAAKLSVLCA